MAGMKVKLTAQLLYVYRGLVSIETVVLRRWGSDTRKLLYVYPSFLSSLTLLFF